MPRPRIIGIALIIISTGTAFFSLSRLLIAMSGSAPFDPGILPKATYYALALPLGFVTAGVLGTGFWIGWTILTLKVETPMSEITGKSDNSKIKALLLCLGTLGGAGLLVYGIIIRSYWALAIPAAAVTLAILGALFWVGWAILTTRTTLPQK